jgi:folate-dependent phosphoribosylglycinamide formyltransferase PurN
VVCAGFMRILKEPVLGRYADRIVNIHPSLLPKFKGREAWVRALEEGELETGCTVHLVTGEIDGGRILAQETVPIHLGDSPDDLLERIQEQEHRLLPRVLAEWRERGLPTE